MKAPHEVPLQGNKRIEKEYKTQVSTVLMIDISHSMILYGEDRITPAKKTAMALAELITTRYPKDTLDIIVFGNDSWQIQIKDLQSFVTVRGGGYFFMPSRSALRFLSVLAANGD